MYRLKRFLSATMLILMPFLFSSFQSAPEEWVSLLDKSHSQWETYLSYRHTIHYKGELPADDAGIPITPPGYNVDTENVFTVSVENNEPILRVSGEIYGCIFTKKEYENYHLRLQVKWGDRKWVPRLDKLKDSGIVYHSIGESGVDYWRAWMLGQEFQIMEGHMGDYWNISTSTIDIRAFLSEGKMNSVASTNQPFLHFGSAQPEGYCMRSADYESPAGEWTTLDLFCFGDKSLHVVNGQVVMVLRNSARMEAGTRVPLTKGKIQLQSEAAEVFFKDIRIRKIKALPSEYAALFNE